MKAGRKLLVDQHFASQQGLLEQRVKKYKALVGLLGRLAMRQKADANRLTFWVLQGGLE